MRVTRFLVLAAAVATPTALILPGSQAEPPPDCETPVASAPEFAPGTTNTVTWTAVTSGGFQFEVASSAALDADGSFVDANLVATVGNIADTATQYTVSDLTEQTHYFHVRAKTKPQVCQASPWGNTVSTTQDATGPVVTGTPDRDPDSNGWYNHALTVTWSATDEGSGVASCDSPTGYSGPDDETASVSGNCTDNAGNIGTGDFDFSYDATAPSAEVDSPFVPVAISALDGKVTGTASDDTSGVASVSVAFTNGTLGGTTTRAATVTGTSTWEVATVGLAPGVYTVTATATDIAGNTGNPSAAVTIIIV